MQRTAMEFKNFFTSFNMCVCVCVSTCVCVHTHKPSRSSMTSHDPRSSRWAFLPIEKKLGVPEISCLKKWDVCTLTCKGVNIARIHKSFYLDIYIDIYIFRLDYSKIFNLQ